MFRSQAIIAFLMPISMLHRSLDLGFMNDISFDSMIRLRIKCSYLP